MNTRPKVIYLAAALMLFLLASGRSVSDSTVAPATDTRVTSATPEPVQASTATPLPLGQNPIYVLDPREGNLTGQVLIVDPEALRVVRSIATRYTPEVAVSPDRRKLFVFDTYSAQVIRGAHHNVVSVYDAATGELVHDDVEVPRRLQYKLYPSMHPFSFLSRNGKRLYIGQYGEPDVHQMRVSVLDSASFTTVSEYAYPNCVNLLPLLNGHLACMRTDKPAVLEVDALSGKTRRQVDLDTETLVTFVASSTRDRLYILSSDGTVSFVDLAVNPPRLDRKGLPLDMTDRVLTGWNHFVVSPDEGRIFVGVSAREHYGNGHADEIVIVDTASWAHVSTLRPSDAAFAFTPSADGRKLYSVNPRKQSLAVFDLDTGREVTILRNVGVSPAAIIVP